MIKNNVYRFIIEKLLNMNYMTVAKEIIGEVAYIKELDRKIIKNQNTYHIIQHRFVQIIRQRLDHFWALSEGLKGAVKYLSTIKMNQI